MNIPINLPQLFKLFHDILGKAFHMEKYRQSAKCKASYYHPTQAPNNAAALKLPLLEAGLWAKRATSLTVS